MQIIKFARDALSTAFSGFLYKQVYSIFYFFGFSFGLTLFFPIFFLAILILGPAAIAAAITLAILVAIRCGRSILARHPREFVGHLAVLPIAAAIGVAGIFSANIAAITYAAPQMYYALAAFDERTPPVKDATIEVISVNPRIVAYHTGYIPGFAAPGTSILIVLDTTGKMASLGSHGHARDLAGSEVLKARRYLAYCWLDFTHMIGPFYRASHYDADDCEPD